MQPHFLDIDAVVNSTFVIGDYSVPKAIVSLTVFVFEGTISELRPYKGVGCLRLYLPVEVASVQRVSYD